jgi:hypothetical protein
VEFIFNYKADSFVNSSGGGEIAWMQSGHCGRSEAIPIFGAVTAMVENVLAMSGKSTLSA